MPKRQGKKNKQTNNEAYESTEHFSGIQRQRPFFLLHDILIIRAPKTVEWGKHQAEKIVSHWL